MRAFRKKDYPLSKIRRHLEPGQISKYGFFILQVVKAHVAVSPIYPETLHYRGEGVFMISGRMINMRKRFKQQNL
jgi:hypothetical protein